MVIDAWNKQIEATPRAVGLFSLSRAVSTYYQDGIVTSTGTRSNPDGGRFALSCQCRLILIW